MPLWPARRSEKSTDRGQPRRPIDAVFAWLDPRELRAVHFCAGWRTQPVWHGIAKGLNRLGDGWLYPPLAFGIVVATGWASVEVLVAAALSAGLSHLIYPHFKAYLARPRPFELDPSLITDCQPLDRYSCPSGHCMTATAALLPLGLAHPNLGAMLLAVWLLLVWARLALAHHYPSDLVLGAGLGALSAACIAQSFSSLGAILVNFPSR